VQFPLPFHGVKAGELKVIVLRYAVLSVMSVYIWQHLHPQGRSKPIGALLLPLVEGYARWRFARAATSNEAKSLNSENRDQSLVLGLLPHGRVRKT
jgi:hypothetical protein